jgi:hypothetical protein
MRLLRPQLIIMLSGALLIVVGVTAVCFQAYMEITSQTLDPARFSPGPSNDLLARPSEFKITTRFAGIELIVIGALLQIVGYLGTQPWKKTEGN